MTEDDWAKLKEAGNALRRVVAAMQEARRCVAGVGSVAGLNAAGLELSKALGTQTGLFQGVVTGSRLHGHLYRAVYGHWPPHLLDEAGQREETLEGGDADVR